MTKLPSTRTFVILALGGFLFFPAGAILFGEGTIDELPHGARLAVLTAAGTAFLVMAYSMAALMVRLFFEHARRRVGPHSARLSAWLGDARHCERVILGVWSVWTSGLVIAGVALLTGAIPH